MKPENSDKRVVRYPKEREEGLRPVAVRLAEEVNKLPTKDEQNNASKIVITLKAFEPGPRVCRVIGNFLIDMANTMEEQDRKYGTDTNDPNQVTVVVKRKGGSDETDSPRQRGSHL